MTEKTFRNKELEILGGKALIYTRNDVWQFRCWLTEEKKYVRLSLKTKNERLAKEKAEATYIELMSNVHNGRKYYGITIAEGVKQYLENKKRELSP